MKLLYLPKLHSFEMDTMIVLTMLAAAQNNLCVEGSNLLKTYVVRAYSRANKDYVLKNRNIYDNTTFKKALLMNIEEYVKERIHLPYDLNTSCYFSKPIPKTFHGVDIPDKAAMIEQKSRGWSRIVMKHLSLFYILLLEWYSYTYSCVNFNSILQSRDTYTYGLEVILALQS